MEFYVAVSKMDIYRNWMDATGNHVKQNKPDSHVAYIRNLKLHEYIYVHMCSVIKLERGTEEGKRP